MDFRKFANSPRDTASRVSPMSPPDHRDHWREVIFYYGGHYGCEEHFSKPDGSVERAPKRVRDVYRHAQYHEQLAEYHEEDQDDDEDEESQDSEDEDEEEEDYDEDEDYDEEDGQDDEMEELDDDDRKKLYEGKDNKDNATKTKAKKEKKKKK